MNKIKEFLNFIKKLETITIILLVAFGLIFILISIILKTTTILETHIIIKELIKELSLALGIVFLAVATIEIIYHLIVYKSHFNDFKKLMTDQLMEMESIQSMCRKLGIKEIFETRGVFEEKYPLMDIIDQAPEDSEIFCIARKLSFLLNKKNVVEKGLKKGLKFRLTCIDPEFIESDPSFKEITYLNKEDIYSSLKVLRNLISSIKKEDNPRGTIDLRYRRDFSDSVLIFKSNKDEKEKLVWDLSFGRDQMDKKIILLEITNGTLGNDLKTRYCKMFKLQTRPIIKYSNGDIVYDEFGWFNSASTTSIQGNTTSDSEVSCE